MGTPRAVSQYITDYCTAGQTAVLPIPRCIASRLQTQPAGSTEPGNPDRHGPAMSVLPPLPSYRRTYAPGGSCSGADKLSPSRICPAEQVAAPRSPRGGAQNRPDTYTSFSTECWGSCPGYFAHRLAPLRDASGCFLVQCRKVKFPKIK